MNPDLQRQTAEMLESQGLREKAKEWSIGYVSIPKSELYATWVPLRRPTYRRGWTYSLAETARFEVVPFTHETAGAALAIVMHEPEESFAAGWVAAARSDEARQMAERFNAEAAAMWKHWRAVQGGAPNAGTLRRLTFEQGHEHAPDARWGLQVVELSEDGAFTYQQRRAGHVVRVGDGTIVIDRARAIFAHLERSTFPQVAAHQFPPGASVLTLALAPDNKRVLLDRRFGLGLDGYREAITELSSLVNAARETSTDADTEASSRNQNP